MTSKLLFVAALLVPGLAYGASANLSIQVVPGSSGSLPGSILPPGNWNIGFDDEFNGTSVDTTKWTNIPADGSAINSTTMWCNSGDAVVSGGTLKVGNVGLSPNGANTYAGCYVQTGYSYGPGYFEARMRMNDSNGWGTFWAFRGPMADCGGTIAQNGYEGDISENNRGSSDVGLHVDGYSSCGVTYYNGSVPRIVYDGNFHLFGMNLDANAGCATYYQDGAQVYQTCPGNIGNPLAQIILSNGTPGAGTSAMEVDFVRWYHH